MYCYSLQIKMGLKKYMESTANCIKGAVRVQHIGIFAQDANCEASKEPLLHNDSKHMMTSLSKEKLLRAACFLQVRHMQQYKS
jgi:hypothetical protein